MPVALLIFHIRHVAFHVRLKLFFILKEVLFRKIVIIHADFYELCKASFKTQVLEGAVLEGSRSKEFFEVIIFTKIKAEELSRRFNLLDFGGLDIVVVLIRL